MVILPPYPPRCALLISFWLVMSLAGGLLVGVVTSLLLSPGWLSSGAAFALVMAGLGLLRHQTISVPYRAWNKLAREFACFARLWFVGICYYIIFVAVGRVGSSLCLTPPTLSDSLWVSRDTFTPTANAHQFNPGETTKGFHQKEGISPYLSWAVQSGNSWALCLWPFLLMLSALGGDEHENRFPTNIYTLF